MTTSTPTRGDIEEILATVERVPNTSSAMYDSLRSNAEASQEQLASIDAYKDSLFLSDDKVTYVGRTATSRNSLHHELDYDGHARGHVIFSGDSLFASVHLLGEPSWADDNGIHEASDEQHREMWRLMPEAAREEIRGKAAANPDCASWAPFLEWLDEPRPGVTP